MDARSVGDDRQVAALPPHARLAERDGELDRHAGAGHRVVVEKLRLEKEREAARSDRRAQQARGVVRERGVDDPKARQRRQPAFDVLRVVEAAADVASRSQAHRDVGHELAVVAPVLVRHLDHLLGRRPEIVGELGPLDDHADLLVQTREAIRRAEDVVLRQRPVEDPPGTELLLHSLGDVEDASLVAVGHVLAPDVGVGIGAELFLQRVVDRLHECLRFARAIRQPLGPLWWRPGLGHDKVEDRVGRRVGRGPGAVGRLLVRPLVLRLDGGDLLLADEAVVDQGPPETGERVRRARRVQLLGTAVELVAVRVGVRMDAHAGRVDDGAPGAAADELDRLAHRAEGIEDTQAVAMDDF